ncbi:RNA polymerase sigma factor [Gaoshiqia sediminis]|uniref:RNA polymerase sigma factor n=1 Tax=Gaoshiqia sediminis TaxID=2986998 RepID=A0AA41Y9U1_9BACT|nr:RNA polymerase sigma factor [Gaoshiqia sediminis]MCW0484286.1 RNA polymerase sigma factor [Gaoshiqia sediminis]
MLASEFKTTILPLSNKLLRFAAQLTKDEDEARDIIQDVFLKLWQKRDSLGQVDNMEAFAMRMTRNRCLDLFRGKHTIAMDDEKLNLHRDEQSNLQQEIELSETAVLIRKLIGQLPDMQRTVMHLRDVEQYEYEEIARVTDLNVNAIRVTLSRARKKVRDELIKHQQYGTGNHQIQTAEIR